MRRIIHVDMDAFYASVEQRDRPALRGQPVIVGADPKSGRGRGVVAACSYEARRFGVHSAQPIRQAWRLCPGGIFLRPRMNAYRAVSLEIMGLLGKYTDLVEPISVDEAFLDVTGSQRLLGPAEAIAHDIKLEISNRTGLVASVGVAPNKFLAKIASDLEKPDGFVIVPVDRVKEFLAPLPVRKLPGVGPRLGQRLLQMGLTTVGQLADRSGKDLLRRLGTHGEHLIALAEGRDDRPVVPEREPRSISNEMTFDHDVDDIELLRQTLRRLSDKVAKRLRHGHYRAGRVTLKLRFASFATHTRQVSSSRALDTGESIFALANRLFEEFALGERVRLLGVGVARLERDTAAQGHLFGNAGKAGELDRAVDSIEERYGEGAIRRASELPETKWTSGFGE